MWRAEQREGPDESVGQIFLAQFGLTG
jgi:hypothetical protein